MEVTATHQQVGIMGITFGPAEGRAWTAARRSAGPAMGDYQSEVEVSRSEDRELEENIREAAGESGSAAGGSPTPCSLLSAIPLY